MSYRSKLAFGRDGRFTVLQIADLHAFAVPEPEDTLSLRRAVAQAKPDLIVMTGDNISGYALPAKEDARAAIRGFMDVLDPFGIPLAIVFGNHDDDKTPFGKEAQLALYETYESSVGCRGFSAERTIGGRRTVHMGNYNLPIFADADSDRVLFNLWCFDSGSNHADPAVDSYGFVFPEQVDWYVQTSNELRAANGGAPVPSLVFQHIAPPHIVRTLREVPPDTPDAVCFAGSRYTLPDGIDPKVNRLREAPCPPNTDLPEGYVQLDAMLRQGDVLAVFFGHDHINCFSLPYRGIDLVCTPGCGCHAYHDEERGFRVITLDKHDLWHYETHILRTEDLLRSVHE
jgi:predicted phosphodiesterase